MRRWVLLAWVLGLVPSASAAQPVRVVMAIGANEGDDTEAPLRHAHDDAARVHQLFLELGRVDAQRAALLVAATASTVRERLAELRGRVLELEGAGHPVSVVVYVSAHGKQGELHLSGSRLPTSELRALVAQSGASVALLIIDACDAGSAVREKGGRPAAEYQVTFDPSLVKGLVVVASSGRAEASQEWESLDGSLFTHHLVTGLRGDADTNGDAQVTLNEMWAYTSSRTVATAALGGQHPLLDVDLTGQGELQLTSLATAAGLVFPPAVEGTFVVVTQPQGQLVAEFDKRAGRQVRVAVAKGRYLVRKRLGAQVALASVDLSLGGDKQFDERAMQLHNLSEVAMKGGEVELTPQALVVGVSLESAPLEGQGPRAAGRLGWRLTSGGWWWLSAGLRAGGSDAQNDTLHTAQVFASLAVTAGLRWVRWAVIPAVGLRAEASWVHQWYARRNPSVEQVLGLGAIPARNTLGAGAGLVASLELPVAERWFVGLEAEAMLRVLPSTQQPLVTAGAQGTIFAGVRW